MGQNALFTLAEAPLWIASPIELPSSRPLRFEGGPSLATTLRDWPKHQVVKCLCFTHPDDPAALWTEQAEALIELFEAIRSLGLELLLEFIPPNDMPRDHSTVARSMAMAYKLGIAPDWWKLPSPSETDWKAEWSEWEQVIEANDPHCRGVVLLGLAAPEDEIITNIERASAEPLCKGFAVGRTIFGDAAKAWLGGKVDDETAKAMMAASYDRLIAAWKR